MVQKLLVVDDELPICELLKISLEAEGYSVTYSLDGNDALKLLEDNKPDLLILDIMLPGINGFDICKQVTATNPIPIIMLTAKSDLVDKVMGLELGADDYITKPFHTREVIARVKALLRRAASDTIPTSERHITNGCIMLYPEKREVLVSGNELELSAKEFDLLKFFMSHIDQVFSREVLLEKVWAYDYAGDTRTVDVHVQRLRSKLKERCGSSHFLQTIFGIGYRMRKYEG